MISSEISFSRVESWLLSLSLATLEAYLGSVREGHLLNWLWLLHVGNHLLHLLVEVWHHLLHLIEVRHLLLHVLSLELLLLHLLLLLVLSHQLLVVVVNLVALSLRHGDVRVLDKDLGQLLNFHAFIKKLLLLLWGLLLSRLLELLLGHLLGLELLLAWLLRWDWHPWLIDLLEVLLSLHL